MCRAIRCFYVDHVTDALAFQPRELRRTTTLDPDSVRDCVLARAA